VRVSGVVMRLLSVSVRRDGNLPIEANSFGVEAESRGPYVRSGPCSTTPEALYWWLWALVRGSRPAGGVSPLWHASAACERLRRTCPGELVG